MSFIIIDFCGLCISYTRKRLLFSRCLHSSCSLTSRLVTLFCLLSRFLQQMFAAILMTTSRTSNTEMTLAPKNNPVRPPVTSKSAYMYTTGTIHVYQSLTAVANKCSAVWCLAFCTCYTSQDIHVYFGHCVPQKYICLRGVLPPCVGKKYTYVGDGQSSG